jgi:uncharacterized protein (DUF2249 family)
MKKLLLLLLFTSSLFAQNPTLTFANKESNVGYGGNLSVTKSVKDSNGNVYLIGNFGIVADFNPSPTETNLTAISSQYGDMYIAKYNSNGDFLWVKGIGGTGYVNCSAVVIGGNFIYMAGKYTNTIDFDPSANNSNLTSANGSFEAAFMAKYDLNGNHISSKSIDGETDLKFTSISFSNNQLLVSGNFSGAVDFDPSTNALNLSSNGRTDIFIAKYSTLFIPQWAYAIGGVDIDTCFSSTVNSSGELIITGGYLDSVDFDPSTTSNILLNSSRSVFNTYIAKYSTSGGLIWAKDIQAKVTGSSSTPIIVCDASNNLIVAGIFSLTSDFDPSIAGVASLTPSGSFVAKYDTNGNYIWAKKLTSTTNKGIIYDGVTTNVNVFGTFTSTTSDFDPGTTVYNLDTTNGTNYFASYDTNGNFVYAKNIQPTITNIINIDFEGIYLTGNFSGSADFDPSTGVSTQYSLLTNGFIGRYDTTGAFVYVKAIGGNKPANNTTNLISTDGSGNIYRAGSLSASTDLDPSSATFNVSSLSSPGIFISKYTTNGNFVWAQTIPGSIGTSLSISVMNTDVNGNTYIIGRATSNGITSMFMLKYDTNGNNLWTKQIIGSLNATRRIVFDSQGNFYITGCVFAIPSSSIRTPIDFDPSPFGTMNIYPEVSYRLSFLAKYSPQGDYIWAKTIAQGNSSSSQFGTATSSQWEQDLQIKNNNLYVTGYFNGIIIFNSTTNESFEALGGLNGFISKYDLNGNYQFAATFVNNDINFPDISATGSVTVDNDGNFYITTYFSGSIDFDLSPNSEYYLTSIPDQINGGYFISYAISKYSSNGTFLWAKSLDSQNVDSGFFFGRIHSFINSNNELILSGQTGGSVDFDPSNTDFVITTPNINGSNVYNIFIAKYNKETGDFIWANKIDSDTTPTLNSVSMNNNQDIFISGFFNGSADFDLSSGVQTLTSSNPFYFDRFWAKYSTTTLGLGENIITKGYNIYPNPTNGELFVSHPLNSEFNITITDITGKVLKTTTLQNNESVDVASYPQGMYFIQVGSENERNTYKFIKK